MHEGKVVHIEDSETLRDSVTDSLDLFSDGRHQVVASAGTREEAYDLLGRIERGELDANVLLLDGSLEGEETGSDALAISQRTRELRLPLKIIGLSSRHLASQGVEVDAELNKKEFTATELVELLDELPEPEVAE